MRKQKPSTFTGRYWLSAVRKSTHEDYGKNIGKWLIWIQNSAIDATWQRIKIETEAGRLGISAKVSTAAPNPRGNAGTHVICVYTYDYEDKADVDRVRQLLREMGFANKIPYKTNKATHEGKYGEGSSLYYE